MKNLGVIIDDKLLWHKHIQAVENKVKAILGRLYFLFKSPALFTSTKLLLYKALVRPILLYAASVWHNVAHSHITKLQTIQNKFLRIILNAPYFTTIETLHSSTQIPKIKIIIEQITTKFTSSLPYHPNSALRRVNPKTRSWWSKAHP